MSIPPSIFKARRPSVTRDSSANYDIHFLLGFKPTLESSSLTFGVLQKEFQCSYLKVSFSRRIVRETGEKEKIYLPVGIHEKEEKNYFSNHIDKLLSIEKRCLIF